MLYVVMIDSDLEVDEGSLAVQADVDGNQRRRILLETRCPVAYVAPPMSHGTLIDAPRECPYSRLARHIVTGSVSPLRLLSPLRSPHPTQRASA